MADSKLIKKIKERIDLLESGNASFMSTIDKVQVKILKAVLSFLKKFSTNGGKLANEISNSQLLLEIERELKKIIGAANLTGHAAEFIKKFETLEGINKAIYKDILRKEIKLPININKKLLTDEVLGSFSNNALARQFINPIKRTLLESITFNFSFSEAEERLRKIIVGASGGIGRLAAYAGQITRDSISRFDGAINDQIRDKFNLEGFMYVGSLVDDSRQNCVDLVKGIGKFAKYAIKEGLYLVKDIPNIIAAAKGGKGFDDSVTPETFASIRMGYNCRHGVVYVPLLEGEVPKRLLSILKV